MRIIFDQGTPVPIRQHLPSHQVSTAFELGWDRLSNGELLDAAESKFDLLITTDQNLKHQQNLSGRRLAIFVLSTTSWPKIQKHIKQVSDAVEGIRPGEFRELAFAE